jgi:hypothetical protein
MRCPADALEEIVAGQLLAGEHDRELVADLLAAPPSTPAGRRGRSGRRRRCDRSGIEKRPPLGSDRLGVVGRDVAEPVQTPTIMIGVRTVKGGDAIEQSC